MRILVVVTLALLALPGWLSAADTVINVPSGWRLEPQPVQLRGGTLAALLSPVAGGPATHAFTWRGGATTLTPLAARPWALDISSDGHLLLVSSLSLTEGHEHADSLTGTIIDSSGSIVTTFTDPIGRSFGMTSSRLLAFNIDAGPGRFELSVYGLDGVRLGRIKPEQRVLGAIALAEPARIAYASGGAITCIDPTQNAGAQLWQAHLVGDEYAIVGLARLSSDRLVVQQSYGWWKILSTAGQWMYTYNPVALDAADPLHDWRYFARYRPYATPNPDWLVLFDGGPEGLLLNIATGQIMPFPLETSVPAGFTLAPFISDYSLLLAGPASVRIRPLPNLPGF